MRYRLSYICNQINFLKAHSSKILYNFSKLLATQDYPSRMSLYKQWIQLFAFIYWVFTLSFNEVIETSGNMKTRTADTWIHTPALPLTSYDHSVNFTPSSSVKNCEQKYLFWVSSIEKIHISCLKIRQLCDAILCQ